MPIRTASVVVENVFDKGTTEIAYPFDYSTFLCPGFCEEYIPALFSRNAFTDPDPMPEPKSIRKGVNPIGLSMLVSGLAIIALGIAGFPSPQPRPVTGGCIVLTRVGGKSYLPGLSIYKLRYYLLRLTQLLSVRQYLGRGKELSPEELWDMHHSHTP